MAKKFLDLEGLKYFASLITQKTGMRYDATTDTVQILGTDGVWHDWKTGGLLNLYLVNNGEIDTDVVGGYSTSAGATALTVVSENGELKITSNSTTYWSRGLFYFTKALSVTNKSKLCMTYNLSSSAWNASSGGDFKMCVSASAPTSYESTALANAVIVSASEATYTKSGTLTLDLTNVSGSVYVWVTSNVNFGSTGGSWTIKIEDMWLE